MKDYMKSLDEKGFVVFDRLISKDRCEFFKEKLERIHERYGRAGGKAGGKSGHGLEDKNGEKVVYNLHNKDMAFFELIEHPLALEALGHLLKPGSYKDSEPFVLLRFSWIRTSRVPRLL